MSYEGISEDDRRVLWEQYVETYGRSQEDFDSSVRAIAAAGVAATVSIGTALHTFPGEAIAAVAVLLGSLGFNLGSYVTAQFDMRARLESLRHRQHEGYEGNRWTLSTRIFNGLAGAALLAGGILLAVFVGTAT